MEPEHLLRVMLDDDQNVTDSLITSAGGNITTLRQNLDQTLVKLPQVTGAGSSGLRMANDLARIAEDARILAEKSGDKFINDRTFVTSDGYGEKDRSICRIIRLWN